MNPRVAHRALMTEVCNSMSKKRGADSSVRPMRGSGMRSGVLYLIGSAVVLISLMWLLPEVMGIDLAGFMRSDSILSILRIALGIAFLLILVVSIRYVIASFTLEGETWRDGLKNAAKAHILSRDFISIVLLAAADIACIAWGATGLIG